MAVNPKERYRLEEVIGADPRVNLHQQGREWVGWHIRHPSHSKESLHVKPDTQVWYCFHCGRGGDLYDWIGDIKFGELYDRRKHFPEVCAILESGIIPTVSFPAIDIAPPPPPDWNPDVYLEYHRQVQQDYWYRELGPPDLIDPIIDSFKLGYCEYHSVWKHPTHTLPVFDEEGRCVNIRHRLVGRSKNKYRPHLPGLGAQIYNVSALKNARENNRILIVAGEKKVLAAYARGIHEVISPTIGCNWKEEWNDLLEGITRRYVLFDPSEEFQARRVATKIGAKVVYLEEKLDDWFLKGYTAQDLIPILGRKIDPNYWSRRLNVSLWSPHAKQSRCR